MHRFFFLLHSSRWMSILYRMRRECDIHIILCKIFHYRIYTSLRRCRHACVVLLLWFWCISLLRLINQFLLNMCIMLSFPVRIHSNMRIRDSFLFLKKPVGITPIFGTFQKIRIGNLEIVCLHRSRIDGDWLWYYHHLLCRIVGIALVVSNTYAV